MGFECIGRIWKAWKFKGHIIVPRRKISTKSIFRKCPESNKPEAQGVDLVISGVFIVFEVEPIPNTRINNRRVIFRITKDAPSADEVSAFVPIPNVTLLLLKPNTSFLSLLPDRWSCYLATRLFFADC